MRLVDADAMVASLEYGIDQVRLKCNDSNFGIQQLTIDTLEGVIKFIKAEPTVKYCPFCGDKMRDVI